MLLLAINLGSTSSKFAVYRDTEPVFVETIRHPKEELAPFPDVISQQDYRRQAVLNGVREKGVDLHELDAVVARGGLTRPLPGGTFVIDEAMLKALQDPQAAKHASSLSGIIAYDIASELKVPVYTVDPVVTDELEPLARVSGYDGIERVSIFHALNQKAVARAAAKELGKSYDQLNLIVAHMGGGVSVGAHKNGRVVDVNNCLDGDGPFSPERAGGLPVISVLDLCMSGKYTRKELYDMFVKKGGFYSYLGVNDGRKAEEMADAGDEKANLVLDAMAYQVSKEIGACAAVLSGKVDAVVLTGGLAYSKRLTAAIADRVSFIARVMLFPGENEMLALVEGALRALRGEEQAKHF